MPPLYHKLQTQKKKKKDKKRWTPRLKNEPHWVTPPSHTSNPHTSGRRNEMKKGNRITFQPRRKATQSNPLSNTQYKPNHCNHQTQQTKHPASGIGWKCWEGNRAIQPLSNCFYGGAFPHCLVHVIWTGCPGTFSQSIWIRISWWYPVCVLWMRFFERGAGEEKKKKKKKRRWKSFGSFLWSGTALVPIGWLSCDLFRTNHDCLLFYSWEPYTKNVTYYFELLCHTYRK